MSLVSDRHAEQPARHASRPAWPAWLALALTPAGVLLSLWLAFAVFGEHDISWLGVAAVLVLMTAAPSAALFLGVRAALAGSRSGRAAATTAAALLVLIVVLVSRWAAVIVAGVALGVGAYWRHNRPERPG